MRVIIAALFLFGSLSFLIAQQTSGQRWEKALYEVKENGQTLLVTELIADNHSFDKEHLYLLKDIFLQKEGVVEFEVVDPKTIRVYHFDYIEVEILKQLMSTHDDNFSYSDAKQLSLETIKDLIREEK